MPVCRNLGNVRMQFGSSRWTSSQKALPWKGSLNLSWEKKTLNYFSSCNIFKTIETLFRGHFGLRDGHKSKLCTFVAGIETLRVYSFSQYLGRPCDNKPFSIKQKRILRVVGCSTAGKVV